MKEGDRLIKLRAVCDRLLKQFQVVYMPRKEVSTDESMVLWRGRLMLDLYIPHKWHKYSIKIYMLCVTSGYVWNARVLRKIGSNIQT